MSVSRLRRRILVVDDTESDREVIQRYLAEDPEYRSELAFASTVNQGVSLAQQSEFDLALVDWMLPDGSGTSFCERLEQVGITLPFVLMTGQTRPRQIDDALAFGAVDFVAKSDLSPRLLSRTCEHAIVRARLNRELAEARQSEVAASKLEREARAAAERALAEQAQLTERVSRLHLLTSLFSAALTTEQVTEGLVTHAAVFGRTTGAIIYLMHESELLLQSSRGFDESEIERWKRITLSVDVPVTRAAIRRDMVLVTSAGDLKQNFSDVPSVRQDSCWIAMPMQHENEVLGVIVLQFPNDIQPTGEQTDFIRLVTELTAQALVRARLYEQAARRAESERRLLAIVGHDLRTPLSAVTTVAAVLKFKYPDEPALDRLTRSTASMAELINDIMARSEALSSLSRSEPATTVNLHEVVHEAAQELRVAFSDREICVVGDDAVAAQLNPRRLAQVISNLVRNAVQYGNPGCPVTISLAASEQGVRIAVHNQGPAIAPEVSARLFDPFRRGRNAGGRGLGLGLFIVNELVTGMGGRVDVSSNDSGTTFTIHLPRDRSPDSAGA